MIEEIKEHLAEYYGYGTSLKFGGEFVGIPLLLIRQWIQILGKYENQVDYKSAWEELKNKTNEELKQATWAGTGLNDTKISMQELEQKYNLGGE